MNSVLISISNQLVLLTLSL